MTDRVQRARTIGIVLVVAILGTAIGVWLATPQPQAPAASMAVTASVPSPARASTTTTPARTPAWGAHANPAVTAMSASLTSAPDLAAFFDTALQHPEAGGIYFARAAWVECLALRPVPDRDRTPLDEAARVRVERARARCGSLTGGDTQKRLSAAVHSLWRSDPALSIDAWQHEPVSVGRPTLDDARRALASAIDLGEASVFRRVVPYAIFRSTTFDGRAIDPSIHDDLVIAVIVASCDLGAECSTDFITAYTCLMPEGCADSIINAALRNDDLTDERRKRIAVLTDRLVDSARDGTLPQLFR